MKDMLPLQDCPRCAGPVGVRNGAAFYVKSPGPCSTLPHAGLREPMVCLLSPSLDPHHVPPTTVTKSPGVPLTRSCDRSTRVRGCHSPGRHGTSLPSIPRKYAGPVFVGGVLTSTLATSRRSHNGWYSADRTTRNMTTLFTATRSPKKRSAPQLHINQDSALSPLCEALHKGEFHQFQRIDLARLSVRGTPGDAVTVIGGTW